MYFYLVQVFKWRRYAEFSVSSWVLNSAYFWISIFMFFDRKHVKEKFITDLRKARDSDKGKEPEEMKKVKMSLIKNIDVAIMLSIWD